FRVFASSSVDATNQLVTPEQILSGTLAEVPNQAPIEAEAFTSVNGLTTTTARYLKFESVSAVNNNAGLNEFEVYNAFTGIAGTGPQYTHPAQVPLVINELTAAGATPFWIELHNYGAALALGGYVIASESG